MEETFNFAISAGGDAQMMCLYAEFLEKKRDNDEAEGLLFFIFFCCTTSCDYF